MVVKEPDPGSLCVHDRAAYLIEAKTKRRPGGGEPSESADRGVEMSAQT